METRRAARTDSDGPVILISGGTATHWPASGYGVLAVPAAATVVWKSETWAADNGAFSGFNEDAFLRMLDRYHQQPGCLFVAAPDVVGNWDQTRRLFAHWAPQVRRYRVPLAIVGQDGVTVADVPWDSIDAVFLGGSTAWKLGPVAADLAAYGRALGKWVHMGRVNTFRRFRYAHEIGCQSVDGTFFSKWPDHAVATAERWRRTLHTAPRFRF